MTSADSATRCLRAALISSLDAKCCWQTASTQRDTTRSALYLHWKILNDLKIPVKEPWLHEPAPVTTNGKVVVFYDKIITAGRYIESSAIRPDQVVWDKENRTAQIIDVCVPNDYGLNRAEREKVTKYQDLKNDLKKNLGTLKSIEVLPVVVGATGLMKTNLQIYLDQIPGKPSKYQVQGSSNTWELSASL